ncbi:protein kinase domain-containing protein [Vacuolonema iberomarrocanum]|uniref:protein kinase domain-containing protein n=1 Tax=Vacuolonema iberomarrocanum TaxID=3454632 RepID=UPI0019F68ABA|nr:protein kinase [filamentous cyanobacterium LEGE 07170]
MITLSLLHPIKQIPVQLWTFENESVIRIGRSTDNHVILYSAVVSRHHVELRRVGATWEVVNLGTNGTYVEGKRVSQAQVTDGSIIRLARSGPNIKIRLGAEGLRENEEAMRLDKTLSQPRSNVPPTSTEVNERSNVGLADGDIIDTSVRDTAARDTAIRDIAARDTAIRSQADTEFPVERSHTEPNSGIIPVPPHLQLQQQSASPTPPVAAPAADLIHPQPQASDGSTLQSCPHLRGGGLFCVDCGYPLRVLDTLGGYQLLNVLGQSDVGITYQAWRDGQTVALKTLNAEWLTNPQALATLEHEADTLRDLDHSQIPELLGFQVVGEKPSLLMQMMPGKSLRSYVTEQGAVSVERAIAWVFEVCQILTYLHEFTPPVAHRDLRPKNLIYNPDTDTLALVDFGAVKRVILERPFPPGSKGYGAPERLQLHPLQAMDIFSLGPLFAFLVTGHNPLAYYAGEDDQFRFQPTMIPHIPSEVVPILHRLTEPSLEDRYDSVDTVIRDLQAVLVAV